MGAPPPNPLGSLASGQTPAFTLYGGRSTEIFLRSERCYFQRNLPLGHEHGQCRGSSSGKCPKKDGPQAVAACNVRAAEFKAFKAPNPGSRGKSKCGKGKTNKERLDKKIAAAVLKAQEEVSFTDAANTTAHPTNTFGNSADACQVLGTAPLCIESA